ncbi:aldo-keto reductase family 1 member C15-like isoform X2 [Ascaphus truei]|uniref:aldo-keto reductase family 1 member C15-like isoform X2 n=1 Tax=Ascaphus truei TaxID=8439 RepID=UPI003F598F56
MGTTQGPPDNHRNYPRTRRHPQGPLKDPQTPAGTTRGPTDTCGDHLRTPGNPRGPPEDPRTPVASGINHVGVKELWSTFQVPDKVRPALERTLQDLQLEYMDLFIFHSPIELKPGDDLFPVDENGCSIYHNTDIRDTWEALEACKDAGLVKSIGVSNFNRRQLELILNKPGLKHKPVCNQVECHIYLNQSKLLAFCKSQDIVLVGYCVLGSNRDEKWVDQDSPVLLEDPALNTIAKKHSRTPAQVAIRFLLQRGIVVLARSFKYNRINENFQVFDFQLSDEDTKTLDALNQNIRYMKSSLWKDHPMYPFNDEY